MTCLSVYATPDDYVSFWCTESRLSRVHDGAGNAGTLTDTMAHFRSKGVLGGVGMIVYNLTDGSQAVITAVDETTLTGTLAGGTDNDWDVGDQYLVVTLDAFERATIEHYLEVTASDVSAALAAQLMCDCTLSSWGRELVRKLNIVDAASFYTCSCAGPKLTEQERKNYRDWMGEQLTLIRTGKLDLCEGAPGAEYPAFGAVKEGITDFARAQIISDRIAKNSP